jgi:hypothetical protein
MSANLDGYLKALEKARKLTPEAELVAGLMAEHIGAARKLTIGAGRRRGMGGSQPGGPRGVPFSSYSPAPCPPGPGGASLPIGVPVWGHCPPEFLCDCDLVGATTFGTAPILFDPAGATTRRVVVSAGDANALQPVAIWFTAFEAAADGVPPAVPQNFGLANPVIELPVDMFNVFIGNQGQLRVGGRVGAELNSAAFAATREPVCVDWGEFTSQNDQQLAIDVRNIVENSRIHVLIVLWTNVVN